MEPAALLLLLTTLVGVFASQHAAGGEDEGALILAAIDDANCAAIESLVDEGANISSRDEIGATPLMRALEKDLPRDCVQKLLQAGADPNATHGPQHISVLMVGASYSTGEVVSLLVESGAEVDFATPDGWTALMSAARNSSRPGVISELVAKGAHVNARDQFGVTPLMRAAQTNPNPGTIEALVDAGADPAIQTPEGHTAQDLARAAGHSEGVLALLDPKTPRAIE